MRALVLALLLFALPVQAQTRAPLLRPRQLPFESNVGGYFGVPGPWVFRPIPGGTAPSACTTVDLNGTTLNPDGRWAGVTKFIFASAEGTIATTETQGAHAGGGALTYRRFYTTTYPVACPNPPGTSPCNTLHDWTNYATCYHPSEADERRGQQRADNLRDDIDAWNASATTYRGADGFKPIVMLSWRWDLLMPSDMQIAGFLPSMLLEAGAGDTLADFKTWLTSDTSKYCAATPAGCTWNDSDPGLDNKDLGMRFKDQIDSFGSPNDYEKYIYYLTRPATAKPLQANGVMANMGNTAYLDWRIARLRAVMKEIDRPNVMVSLSDKISQVQNPTATLRNGTQDFSAHGRCPTVTDLLWASGPKNARFYSPANHAATSPYQSACRIPYNGGGTNGEAMHYPVNEGGYTSDIWAAGVTYENYVLSLRTLADKLIAAGIPYVRATSGNEFGLSTWYNYAGSTGTDEKAVIRSLAMDASFVYIAGGSVADRNTTMAALDGAGIPYVVQDCGDGVKSEFEVCDDGNDVRIDSCSNSCTLPSQCNNGLDDDLDGLTDYPYDPGCLSAADTSE